MAYSRVQFKSASSAAATTLGITMDAAPTNGNILVILIGTTGATTGRVSSISQTGVTWARVNQVANAVGAETETWHGTAISSASASLTVNLAASLVSGAVVAEYSGSPAGHGVDKIATNTGTATGIDSGTTATTTLAAELWVGGGTAVPASGLSGSAANGFTKVAQVNVTTFFVVYCDKIVAATAAANTSVAFSPATDSEGWSGNITTFGAVNPVRRSKLAFMGVA